MPDSLGGLLHYIDPLQQAAGGLLGGGGVQAYHGTPAEIGMFRPEPGGYMLDRGLGPHFAADPSVASKFAMGLYRLPGDVYKTGLLEGGKMYPVKIDASKFKKVDQPPYDWRTPDMKPWQGILTDQTAISNLVALEGFKARPDLLERYLVQARHVPGDKAKDMATALVAGEKVNTEGGTNSKAETLKSFVENYGGNPHNQEDRNALVDAARTSLMKQGYHGLMYLNTSPMETEGIKDATTYLPFASGTVRSALTGATMFGLLGALGLADQKRQR